MKKQNTRMEVLFISHKFPPEIGGMQKQSFELISGFQKKHKVHKIIIAKNESKVNFFRKLKRRVDEIMRDNPSIEIVHCNDGVCGYFSRFIKSAYGVPVIITFHGLDLLWPFPYYRKVLKNNYVNWFSGFIAVSKYTAERCMQLMNTTERVHFIPNGVDTEVDNAIDKINPQAIAFISRLRESNKRVLISIGRPTKRKGFSWFVNSVMKEMDERYHYLIIGPDVKQSLFSKLFSKILPKKAINYIELFLGSSNDQDSLLEYKRGFEFEEQSNVSWLTNCNYPTLLYLLREADLFVMPNVKVSGDAEGFGLVALESVMQNCYVIASNIDGIPSAIVDNENGKLLESGNKVEWIETINSFFELEPDVKLRLSYKAKEYTIQNYSWRKMVDNYERVFFSFKSN